MGRQEVILGLKRLSVLRLEQPSVQRPPSSMDPKHCWHYLSGLSQGQGQSKARPGEENKSKRQRS